MDLSRLFIDALSFLSEEKGIQVDNDFDKYFINMFFPNLKTTSDNVILLNRHIPKEILDKYSIFVVRNLQEKYSLKEIFNNVHIIILQKEECSSFAKEFFPPV